MAQTRENNKGFTLIEVMLSVVLMGILAGLSLPVYANFQNRNDLDITAQTVAHKLRLAQSYSRGVNEDSSWGMKVQAGSITLFKGSSYAARDQSSDESTSIPSSIAVSGSSEFVFSKLSGNPTTTGIITLTASTNDTRSISINTKGMVDY